LAEDDVPDAPLGPGSKRKLGALDHLLQGRAGGDACTHDVAARAA
jgi:hypothetical protein